jgi:hypothetical protein
MNDQEFKNYILKEHPKSFLAARINLRNAWDDFITSFAEAIGVKKLVEFLSKYLK